MRSLIVIPARYHSTRFPGKPLQDIAGHTLLSRVISIARQVCAENDAISYVIATDHEDIKRHAADLGANAVMTDPGLPSGSDRVLAAAEAYDGEIDFILNLQGDAPFTPPGYITALIEAIQNTDCDVVTPIVPLSWEDLDIVRRQKQHTPFSGTSCVFRDDGEAMWFSKQILPAIRKEDQLRSKSPLSPVWRHIGLYGYRLDALRKFVALPTGHYENLEGLEQLRFLENGMRIKAVRVTSSRNAMWGVDTPEDAAHARELIELHGDPFV
ncbi:MAG: 3-deoxy-manno-octulosonate cytidylyltransferase [Henriciella sp.]